MTIEVKNQYKQTVNFVPATFLAGETLSDVIGVGGMLVRGILIPETWTTSDMTFIGSRVDVTSTNYLAYNIQNFDGVNKTQLLTPGVQPQDWVPLYAHWFDHVPYVQLQCSIAQDSETTVLIALQPLYQGVHG